MSAADRCERCGQKARVRDVRRKDGELVRERQCSDPKCGHRWTTVERRAALRWVTR